MSIYLQEVVKDDKSNQVPTVAHRHLKLMAWCSRSPLDIPWSRWTSWPGGSSELDVVVSGDVQSLTVTLSASSGTDWHCMPIMWV